MYQEDNLDELLSFMDEDEDLRTDPANSSSRYSAWENSQNNSESINDENSNKKRQTDNVTFEDIFGSPIKRRKTENAKSPPRRDLETKTKPKSSTSSNEHSKPSNCNTKSSIANTSKKSSLSALQKSVIPKTDCKTGLDTTSVVTDPYSKLRIYKTSLTLPTDEFVTPEAAMKDRNIGLKHVNLLSFLLWYRNDKGQDKNFWTNGILVRKTPGLRKSSNGNDYVIWELNDLKNLEKSWTLFLFGSAATSSNLAALPIGTLIDITTPTIMESNGQVKFSVSNPNQIRLIGTSKDFGFCSATKKDGKNCLVVVNKNECPVCIHHASGELRKMQNKLKGNNKQKSNAPSSLKNPSTSQPQDGVMVSNFGGGVRKTVAQPKPGKNPVSRFPNQRMELQGPNVEMKRTTLKFGNHESISFPNKEQHILLANQPKPVVVKKDVNLNPNSTRHLSDKDRMILESLSNSAPTSDIPAMISSNPNAAGRNLLQFLNKKETALEKKKNEAQGISHTDTEGVVKMTRETLKNMQKALQFVKNNGPIKKQDPNKTPTLKPKTVPNESKSEVAQKTGLFGPDGKLNKKSEEFNKILNAKSAHEQDVEEMQQEEYFNKLAQKESLEEKLLSTYSISTTAVMCRQCKYVALGPSDLCKRDMHTLKTVKAMKRFFKCKDCGNRAMSLDRLPKRPCKTCSGSNWEKAPVGKERKGPTLASETLCLRGDEEKFLGSSSAKLFL